MRTGGFGKIVGVRVVVGATGNVGTSLVQLLAEDPEVESILGVARRLPTWTVPKTIWKAADIGEDDLVPLLRGAAPSCTSPGSSNPRTVRSLSGTSMGKAAFGC